MIVYKVVEWNYRSISHSNENSVFSVLYEIGKTVSPHAEGTPLFAFVSLVSAQWFHMGYVQGMGRILKCEIDETTDIFSHEKPFRASVFFSDSVVIEAWHNLDAQVLKYECPEGTILVKKLKVIEEVEVKR